MVIGNFAVVYLNIIAIRTTNNTELLGAVLMAPLYWAMMSIAAVKASLQLVFAPFFWEKTTHGLDPQSRSSGSIDGAHD